ncbi:MULTISPECIES: TetR/AcrR family transcriptional regulator [unclassified Paraburkholderia]|uniref:TetR/AcrR family transcriptional regulator n=1 Tax=unclassified Paraburkholderia TaxID=2615204 RepID=UPI002AAF3770|nr:MULTISPECIES: TetR/AcrR family transcriptional regulator [unclassified Paraburkholderia]
MSTTEPKDTRAAALRARILDAARRIVLREGIDALSMRKIASAIGYSPASLYLHFEGRDAIARALGHEGFTQLLASLQPCTEIAEPRVRLHALAHAYVTFGFAHPDTYRMMFFLPGEPVIARVQEEGAPDNLPSHADVAAIEALFVDALAPVCADPTWLSRALWALLHGFVAFSFPGPASVPESASLPAIDAALDAWLAGYVRPRAPQNTPADTT